MESRTIRHLYSLALVLAASLIASCGKNPDGSMIYGTPGSPAWFNSAAPEVQYTYFSGICSSYGYLLNTNEMRGCIEREARSRQNMNFVGLLAAIEAHNQATQRKGEPDPIIIYQPPQQCAYIGNGVAWCQ